MTCKICGSKTKTWYKRLFDDRHGYRGYFNILRCPTCGFAQTSPQVNTKQIKNLYKNYYPRQNLDLKKIKRENHRKQKWAKLWRKGLLTGCHYWVKPGTKVLDVGSGVGFSLLYLENIGCEAYGIDPDANGQKLANKFKLNFHLGFIDDKPFGKKRFDYVIASQVMEHINNPLQFLKLCKQRLKPGGQIILSVPNTDSLTRKLLGKRWLHWHIPYHLNHFNKGSIKILVEKTGLEIQKITTVTPNMWTNLQIRTLMLQPKMGKRDKFWDGGKENSKLASSGLKRAFLWLEEYGFFNRLIDSIGLGESFVVRLSVS